ncbi:hypothetical protein PV327_001725 [Microctonus hyperodae]|uniref:Uncharacterized protein n=1 Tax=Microctonus hyperodae TaxID=165561 RepID=A0AA39FE66_MICHY|nr:hypothetical protein PV327_001725 [Microctonus hyperodae]
MIKLQFIMFVIMMMMMMTMIESFAIGSDSSLSSSLLTAREIPIDTTQTSSYSSDIFQDTSEKMSENEKIPNVNKNIKDDVKATTPNIVLKPNIAGALDVGQGLLVPLVPVVDPNTKNNQPQASPLVANLLPVSVETITPSNIPTKVEVN